MPPAETPPWGGPPPKAAPPQRRTVLEALRIPGDGWPRRAGGVAGWLVALRWLALLVLVPIVAVATTGDHVAADSVVPLWLGASALLVFGRPKTDGARRRRSTAPISRRPA